MRLYPENYAVEFDFLFTDLNGAAVEPTAVKASLYDGDDEMIVDFGAISFDLADGKVTVRVPAELNALGEGELSAVRIVRCVLVTPAGDISRSVFYIVEGEARLEIMTNSFMSLEAAEALARDIPNLTGWETADDEARSAALINAYARLVRIQMRYGLEPKEDSGAYRTTVNTYTLLNSQSWPDVTKDDFLSFPKAFKLALRQAQLVEANSILTDNPIEARHRAGVISETVGESSIMLRGGRLELGVSAEALRYLTGFVYYNWTIARR